MCTPMETRFVRDWDGPTAVAGSETQRKGFEVESVIASTRKFYEKQIHHICIYIMYTIYCLYI